MRPKPVDIIEEHYEGKHMLMFDLSKTVWDDPLVDV
jgi:hypothetical protein